MMTTLDGVAVRTARRLSRHYGPDAVCSDLDRICRDQGCLVRRRDLPVMIDGFYYRSSRGPVITLNVSPALPPKRIRWTLAHELGHHVFAETLPFINNHIYLELRGQKPTPLERACNRFAGEFLMPREMIREWYYDLRHNQENRIAILANRFAVTPTAVRVRLKELSLAP